jgi:UDP-N-acetylmuramate dehydrogenase
MSEMQEYVDIRKYSTLQVGGQFRYLFRVTNTDELGEVYSFSREKDLPVFVLGGGSNIVFHDGVLHYVVIKMEIQGFQIIEDAHEHIDIKVGAGVAWDTFVAQTVAMELSGIEAMSAIPGTVGATPVQNVGAYGQEAKDTIVSVEVFDIENNAIKILANAECAFAYRDSIFKNEAKGKYVITSVTYRLSKKVPTMPNYPGVKKYFDEKKIAHPTLQEIRTAIIDIRKNKLPDPKDIPSAGSFFKNPIVSRSTAEKLKEEHPSVTIFPVDDERMKIPAGWLIEQAGLKGKDFGALSTYIHNALVLVNNGSAVFADVESVRDQIVTTVFDKFGITLEVEPEFV